MYGSPVVFCERTGTWAAAWRRLQSRRNQTRPVQAPTRGMVGAGPRLIETRSTVECREMVAANRGSFVVVELEPARAEQAFDLLLDLGIGFADAASGVVAGRTMLGHEWLARELGAQAFVVSLLDLERLYDLAQRHAGRASAPGASDVRERIWNNLPWGKT